MVSRSDRVRGFEAGCRASVTAGSVGSPQPNVQTKEISPSWSRDFLRINVWIHPAEVPEQRNGHPGIVSFAKRGAEFTGLHRSPCAAGENREKKFTSATITQFFCALEGKLWEVQEGDSSEDGVV